MKVSTWEGAVRHFRFKTKVDACGEPIVPGKLGHLFWYPADMGETAALGAMFLPQRISKGWKKRREALVAAGATIVQNGDTEGTLRIPLDNKTSDKTVRLACRLLGVRLKRELSAEEHATLVARLAKARSARKETAA